MESRKCQSHNFCLTVLSLWVLMNRSWKCRNAEFQYKMYLTNLSSKCIYIYSGMGFPHTNFRACLKLIWCEEQYFLKNKEKCYIRVGDLVTFPEQTRSEVYLGGGDGGKCISIIDGGSGYSLKMSLWRGVDGDSQFPYQERWGIGGNDWKLGGPLHTQR